MEVSQQRMQSMTIDLLSNGIDTNVTPITIYYQGEIKKNSPKLIYNETIKTNGSKDQRVQVIRLSEDKIKDDIEIVKSEIANLFDINIPEVKRINTNQGNGIISYINGERNSFISYVSETFSDINYKLQTGIVKIIQYPEYRLQPNNPGNPITDLATINLIIQKGLRVFPDADNFGQVDPESAKDYLNMILLDLIIGQKRRGGDKYFIKHTVYENNNFTDKIIPGINNYDVLDEDSTINLSEEEYELNGFVVDRTSLLSVLLTQYLPFIKKIVSPLASVTDKYKDCISRIIYNNIDEQTANVLEDKIFANLENICNCYKQIPNSENKVELASTTAQLNLAIAHKETEVLEKYPFNPKENSLLQEEVEADERVKITEGKELTLKPNGYATVALIGGLVSVIVGIGAALALMILRG